MKTYLKIAVLGFIFLVFFSSFDGNLFNKNYRKNYLWRRVLTEIAEEKKTVNDEQRKHHFNEERLIKKLTIEIGPEETLSIINASNLPRDATSHFLAHKVGEEAYKMYGDRSLVHCTEDDLNGCTHGLIIAAVTNLGFDGVIRLLDQCKNISPFKFKMCVHGAGHSFTALYDYKILPAIELCDKLANYYNDSKEVVQWCGSGLFMENTFGEHNDITPKDHPYLSKKDLMYPCNNIHERYKPSCYQNLPGWWNMVFLGDKVKMTKYCANVPAKYLDRCAQGVGAVVDSAFDNDLDKIREYCLLLPEPFPDYCFSMEAQNLFTVGQTEMPSQLCNWVSNKQIKKFCYLELKN